MERPDQVVEILWLHAFGQVGGREVDVDLGVDVVGQGEAYGVVEVARVLQAGVMAGYGQGEEEPG